MRADKRNTRYWIFIAALVAAIGGYAGYEYMQGKADIPGGGSVLVAYTPDEKATLEKAYEICRRSISARGAEFERSIPARGSRIPELAEELTGWAAK